MGRSGSSRHESSSRGSREDRKAYAPVGVLAVLGMLWLSPLKPLAVNAYEAGEAKVDHVLTVALEHGRRAVDALPFVEVPAQP